MASVQTVESKLKKYRTEFIISSSENNCSCYKMCHFRSFPDNILRIMAQPWENVYKTTNNEWDSTLYITPDVYKEKIKDIEQEANKEILIITDKINKVFAKKEKEEEENDDNNTARLKVHAITSTYDPLSKHKYIIFLSGQDENDADCQIYDGKKWIGSLNGLCSEMTFSILTQLNGTLSHGVTVGGNKIILFSHKTHFIILDLLKSRWIISHVALPKGNINYSVETLLRHDYKYCSTYLFNKQQDHTLINNLTRDYEKMSNGIIIPSYLKSIIGKYLLRDEIYMYLTFPADVTYHIFYGWRFPVDELF